MDAATLLGVAETDPDDVLEHFVSREHEGRSYRAMPDARHGIERGTVLIDDTAVRGFPSVPRTLVLDPGVSRYFEGVDRVAVEEKLDGFNVRIVCIDGVVVAFTRSGYVCPYTTDRARALLDAAEFFDSHPDRMLCAEFVGPETPYTDHDYEEIDSHEFRVFDVRDRTSGDPLPVADRRDLCERYGFAQPDLFGTYRPDEAADPIAETIDRLDERAREGVIVRSTDGRRLLKYTTSAQHRDDLAYGFSIPFDAGRDFVFARLIREGFQAAERGEGDEVLRERAHAVGESILLPMVEAIEAVRRGEPVGEEHTIRGDLDGDGIDALFEHFEDLGLRIEVLNDRIEGDERVVTFRKVSQSSTDQIRSYLDGGVVDQ